MPLVKSNRKPNFLSDRFTCSTISHEKSIFNKTTKVCCSYEVSNERATTVISSNADKSKSQCPY